MIDTTRPEARTDDLPAELIELGLRIAALPEPQGKGLKTAYSQVVECVHRRRRILALVQEALSQLRLDVKYLMFDLDATRRERDELAAQLEQWQGDSFDAQP
jgi:hypothetical protein